ncbi:LysR family transcriptional regulator [Thalassotalea euphylliae]|uniref:LysR family transcriptional regulator n=1 Tax=Thalassotalea euphylliae TaxID=1655234 RepID=UPI003627770C
MLHSKIDLNLFTVLLEVYQQGSITAAAEKLHITQPAVSHSLAKLREKFNDPLFIRHGRKMMPSPTCQTIMPQIIESLANLEATLVPNTSFDITQHHKEIKLGLRDILESLFFPPLVTDLVTNTPNIKIRSRQISHLEMEQLLTEQAIDIVIDVLVPTSEKINSKFVCNEHFSLVCRPDHPILKAPTIENYQRYPHGIVSLKGSTVDIVDMALAKHGVSRNVALRCEHYFAAASVACRCDMLLTMPNAYANTLKGKLPIVVSPLPFEVPLLPVHMYWHQQNDDDQINQWMREKLFSIADQLFPMNTTTN